MLTSSYRLQTLISLQNGVIDTNCSSAALNAVHLDASDIRNWEVFAMKSLYDYVILKSEMNARSILMYLNRKRM